MSRILYLMHVSWSWIKQRPHFIAGYLSEDYDVTVFCKAGLRERCNNFSGDKNLNIHHYKLLPFRYHSLTETNNFEWINKYLFRIQIGSLKHYNLIWISDPFQFLYLKSSIPSHIKVIYDCMDDLLEFPENTTENIQYRHLLLKAEKELIIRANKIICSSDYLGKKLHQRYMINKEFSIINNAIELPTLYKEEQLPEDIICAIQKIKNKFIFMYVGTISEWFDMDLINNLIKNNPQIHIVLVGPTNITIPQNSNIIYLGTIDRKYIFNIMNYADALIMPFILNELIKSVNPVKMYEYIYMAKPIISINFLEMEKFSEYIYLYDTPRQFYDIANRIQSKILGPKCLGSRMIEYARHNTWNQRYKQIKILINS